MKLYYSPGACSLSPHIVLKEAGLPFQALKVDLRSHGVEGGGRIDDINPKGYVPALVLDGGEVLTEGAVIVQFLADKAPASGLMPPVGSMERVRVQEWLNFITAELHKGFSPLFSPDLPAETRKVMTDKLTKRIAYVDGQLAGRDYLMGKQFTVADAYLFTVLGWSKFIKLDLSPWANIGAYMARVAARPQVQAALKAEGLLAA